MDETNEKQPGNKRVKEMVREVTNVTVYSIEGKKAYTLFFGKGGGIRITTHGLRREVAPGVLEHGLKRLMGEA